MWKDKIQDVYDSLDELIAIDDTYHLSTRLGFKSAEELWDANPMVQGSTDPSDYKLAKEFKVSDIKIGDLVSFENGEFYIIGIKSDKFVCTPYEFEMYTKGTEDEPREKVYLPKVSAKFIVKSADKKQAKKVVTEAVKYVKTFEGYFAEKSTNVNEAIITNKPVDDEQVKKFVDYSIKKLPENEVADGLCDKMCKHYKTDDNSNDMKTTINGYVIQYNSLYNKWIMSHPEIGAGIGEYADFDDAVIDANKG